jgi:hypothetical protein
VEDLTMLSRLVASGGPDSVVVGVLVVGAGVVVVAGAGDETGLSKLDDASFVIGAAVSAAVVTEPVLRLLLELADELLEGSEAGTTPLLPVRPSQRPWQEVVVDPEPVVPGWRPCTTGVLLASGVPVVVVSVAVVSVVVVPVLVVGVVVVSVGVVDVSVVEVVSVVVGVGVVVVSVGVVDVSVGVVVVSVGVGVVVVAVVVVDASVGVGAGAVDVVVAAAVEAGSVVAGAGAGVASVAAGELRLGVIARTSCSGER